jgi:Secretion system C-terminal sorting domain
MIYLMRNLKVFLVLFACCFTILSAHAAKKISNLYSGNWYDGSIWAGGVAPSTLDVVTIIGGTTVNVYGGYADCDSLTINGSLEVGRANFTVGGRDLYTDYRAIRNTSCIINGGLRVDGDWDNQFKVYGNMKFNPGSTFDMPAGKVMIDGAAFTPELSVSADKALLDVSEAARFNSTGGLIILFNPHFFQNGLSIKGAKHFFAVSFGNNDALTTFAARTTNDFFVSETEKPTIQNVYLKYLPNPARQNKVILNDDMLIETLQLAKGVLADRGGRLKFSKDVFLSEDTKIECDVELNGIGEQKIGTFNNSNLGVIKGNLIINNPNKIQCFMNLEVQNGTIQFLQGKFDLTDKTVTLSSPPTGCNANSYFISKNNYSSNGTLLIKNLQGNTLFPVGTDNDYLPVNLTAFSSDFSVSARPLVNYPNNGFFPLNAQWDIKRVAGNSSANIQLQWTTNVENYNFSTNRQGARLFRYESGNWYPLSNPTVGVTSINSVSFSKNAQNIEYFTSFTVLAETVVPVELKRFFAKSQSKNDLTLAWETATEINNAGFDVEKSSDGKQFLPIGFIKGAVNSIALNTYNFTDNNFINTAYYRLKQLDINGRFTYSPIISVQKSGDKLALNIYPNLITNQSEITLNLINTLENTVNLVVFDTNGRLIFEDKQAKNGQLMTIPVNDLAKGIYFIKATNGKETVTTKFIKN